MAGFGFVLNPTSNGFPAQLDISDGATYVPTVFDAPPPAPNPAYASSYTTEGSVATDEAHYENREITIGLTVYGGSAANLETSLNALYKMVGQINREGGVLKFTTPNGTVGYFDLVPATSAATQFNPMYAYANAGEVELRLGARPFWRGAEVSLGTVSETTLPALVATFTGGDGDVPSLGRLVVTDTESGGKDRWTVIVGGQSRYYSAAATAALFYQAEDLTPTGTSTKTAGASGASGAGSNVVRNTDLTTTYQATLKSEIDATNAALTNKGTYRVWARLYRPTGNTGAVSVRLEWGEGDYTRVTQNDAVAYAADDREGVFTWANLGIVSIEPASTRWEFRLLAKSTVAGDEIDVDCFVLFPTDVTYIELSGKLGFQTSSAFLARDEFNQTAGALAGKTAAVGGTWSGAGDTDDFQVDATNHQLTRTAVSDFDLLNGRYAKLGTGTATAVLVQATFGWASVPPASGTHRYGVLARHAGTNDWVGGFQETDFTADPGSDDFYWRVVKCVSGTATTLATVSMPPLSGPIVLRLLVDAAGRFWLWSYSAGTGASGPLLSGYDADLATGGALATGGYGVYDAKTGATALSRTVDDFFAATPVTDAALFAGRTMTLAHNGATRQDSTGSFPTRVSYPDGRYLKVPPAGPEGRSTRLAVLALPNDPYTMSNPGFYDLSAELFVTPRGLVVPEA